MDDKLKITVLRGGISAEREVSLISGAAVANALRSLGHQVFESDVGPNNLAGLDQPCDVVFPVLHGVFGEDGQIQEILEQRGLPYVGCRPPAARLAMDKARTKACLAELDVPTAPWEIVGREDFTASWRVSHAVGLPCVAKPPLEGSSVGCKVCHSESELRAFLAEMLQKYPEMMLERFITGPELTIGIIDGQALPTIQIIPATTFYDYDAKYQREDTRYVFDIDLPAATLAAARDAAVATYKVLNVRHLGRVDVMVDARTNQVYVLEINTMPGFTSHSLVPKAAAKAGIAFPQLCHRLVHLALRDVPANSYR